MARARVLDADSLEVLSAVSSPATSDPFCSHLQQVLREIRKFLPEYSDVLSTDSFYASSPKLAVRTVNRVRFSNLFNPLFLRFLSQLAGSATFTWTWLALFTVPVVLTTSSPSWTGPPVGLRSFHCPQPPLGIVLESWFPVGSQGSVFQPRLHLTVELNSLLLFGVYCVLFWTFLVPRLQVSILNLTASLNLFHSSLKTSLWARLAGPDWFIVMFGLWTTPCDKTGFSAAKAVYSGPLCLLGEFLESEDLLPREFLDRIQSALPGLTLPTLHQVAPSSARVPVYSI